MRLEHLLYAMTAIAQKISICFLAFGLFTTLSSIAQDKGGQESFEKRIIIDKLEDPWNIIYGPDDHLWITESKTYKILRINPATGQRQTVLDVSSDKNFDKDDDNPWP